ncbi:MAG: Hpt domain-containing protein [Zoogloea sp.]|uniref:hybrid sensor histidine kinase/response regulator n=1 Tax=Zoogloea sp. TaxID=49181 RepID=UPI002625B702|nr:Hpt domain-containing protein [Zoogloea sp.]MDD3328644.1 Hpt domain-containing protein [Zoogloea sp.]
MSPAHELDLGPLTWVKGEIDLALERATTALAEAGSVPDSAGKIKFAQTHLHQAHGALSIVGLDGLTQFSEQLDRLLGEMAGEQIAATPEVRRLASRCIAAIGNYLDELTRGQPDQALRLFSLYSELAAARGLEAPTAGELFFPDLSRRPAFSQSADTRDDPKRLRALRGRFERGLLKWFRNGDDPAGPQEMREAVAGIESMQGNAASRAFWFAATAFFDALGQQAIPSDAGAKRLCGRIDGQMRRFMEGSAIVAERLMRDVLYHVAIAAADSPAIGAVRSAYELSNLIPSGKRGISDMPLAPILRKLRDELSSAREAWDQFSKGGAVGLPRFQDAIAPVIDQARALDQPEVAEIAAALGDLARWLRQDPLRLTDALSMDVATTMLVLDTRLDAHARPDLTEDVQIGSLLDRLKAHQRGERLSPLAIVESDAQSRQVNRQLIHEIQTSLAEVEQSLDSFFRAPAQTDILAAVRAPLKQVEGALSVMNEDAAMRLVQDAAARIAALSAPDADTGTEAFEEIAHRLSALGVYIEALQHGPADLERILRHDAGKAPAADSIETELAQQKRETAALAAALKDNPEDVGLRTELQLNLESLRQDASLTADLELEKQARQALTLLDAGELFTEATPLPQAPAAPALSAEATRLLEASEEELDAELLAIFLEEAEDVRDTIAARLAELVRNPHDVEVLTTIRRSFHTLKGSGRMVGLRDFGEAAWGMEQTLNHWLRLEIPVTDELLKLIGDAHADFSAWIDQIKAGAGIHKDVSALLAVAERLRSSGDAPAAEAIAPPPAAKQPKPVKAAPDMAATQVMSNFSFGALEDDAALEALEALENEVLENDAFEPVSFEPKPLEPDLSDLPILDFGEPASAGAPVADVPPASPVDAEPVTVEPVGIEPAPAAFDLDFELPGAAPEASPADAALDFDFTHDEAPAAPAEPSPTETALDFDLERSSYAGPYSRVPADTVPPPEAPPASPVIDETSLDFDFDHGGDTPFSSAEAITVEELAADEAPPIETPLTETAFDLDFAFDDTETQPLEEEATAPEVVEAITLPELPELPDDILTVDEALEALEPEEAQGQLAEEISAPATELEPEDVLEAEALLDAFDTPVSEAPEPLESADSAGSVELSPDEVRLGHVILSRPLFDLYLVEARQHVATLRHELARLSVNPSLVPVAAAIRAAHTLAGISGTARFEAPQQLAKALELAQQRLADHDSAPAAEETAALNAAATALEGMLIQLGTRQLPVSTPELVDRLNDIQAGHLAEVISLRSEAPAPAATPRSAEPAPAPATPQLRDELDTDLLPIFLDEGSELLDQLGTSLHNWRTAPDEAAHPAGIARLLHTLKGSARMVGAMSLGQSIHDLETRLERARHQGDAGLEIIDELETALDQTRQTLDNLAMPEAAQPAPAAASTETAIQVEEAAPAQPGDIAAQAARTQLRVESGRIDQFVNEAGEISIARTRIEGELRTLRRSLLDLTENVIRLRNQLREVEIQADTQMQSRLSQVETHHTEFDPLEMDRYTRLQELTRMMAESVGDVTTVQQNLLKNLDGAEVALHAQSRMTRELQQSLMHVRMVPFDSLAERLYRLVRQTAKELGRRANLDIIGGQIEIDRSVLEAMTAPLGHLVRNAVAHGIEPPEVRRAAGKPEIGQITLKVTHEGSDVVIEFRDDGAGLDFARIRAQAIANGLIKADEETDEKRLTNLIFVPGFSTASLSSLAGRGVGMDVVKSETAAVGGRISVSTDPSQGTTFRINLPLTLAVAQALLVRSGGRTFAIPSSMVAQVLELKATALDEIRNNRGTEWMGEHFSYRYLPRLLGDFESQPQADRFNWVLLLRAGSETLALHVDSLRGNQEIVVKNAGPQYARMVGFSGATVLGDGEIVLILNPVALAGRSPAAADDGPVTPMAASAPSQPTVMVVDDSLTVRKITGRLLEREGYRVVTAKDGVDALEQLLSLRPDVIIADIEMPRMDGFDLTRNIRADMRLKAVPIIMITSRTAEKHKRYAEEIGVNHYLGKPYDEDVLLELIRGFVEHGPA